VPHSDCPRRGRRQWWRSGDRTGSPPRQVQWRLGQKDGQWPGERFGPVLCPSP